MNYIFKFLLTINSLLFSLVVFLVNQGITINSLSPYLSSWPSVSSYVFYVSIIVMINIFSLWMTRFLGNDSLSSTSVVSIDPANDAFLPTYLGYFFVALSVQTIGMFAFVFAIIAIFIFFSRISYFNPFLFLHGYGFYYVVNANGVKVLVISKKKIKKRSEADFNSLKRINDFTFIDMED